LPRETDSFVSELPKPVSIQEIANETFAIAGEGGGLVAVLREVFNSENLPFKEYPGQALSYAVLEDWAALGVGATILPKSKISKRNKNARPLNVNDDKSAIIVFETV
jgi:LysR family transcriptional regulator, hydrogen peroxide-inducible genes activator